MDKETLLDIILKDIAEIETLIKSFHGQEDIPGAFLNLTENKLSNISEEFELLKKLNEKETAVSPATKIEKQATTVEKAPPIVEPLATKEIEQEVIEETIVPEIIQETPATNEEMISEHQYDQANITTTEHTEKIDKPKITVPNTEATTSKQDDIPKTIGESFVTEKRSVNDLIANTQESNTSKTLKGKPIQDLTRGLGINDRFMFQRELFGGKMDILNQTLQQLNDMPDYTSAKSFIRSNFNWDEDQEVTKAFFNYIERKF
ncbi:hypothetical protein [Saccharicrinis fermentans]|uniref:Uncharacterized protein n=1 Tax=Saccharicrinis fermentans DSM 9555 = JCM 21142 TaxID=869213 RepID=W7Y3F8_9BACT|nr:hypothetical protein [Saccharicrinis fermentans]GAF02557.1 hypothetical protein JCM21142_31195 [Saccharicrinis fermentans DSM 9555 = JCM 21142]